MRELSDLWITPEKYQANRKNVRINRKNVRIAARKAAFWCGFQPLKTGKNYLKTYANQKICGQLKVRRLLGLRP